MIGRLLAGALVAGALAAPANAAPWHAWVGTSGDDAGHGVVSRGEAIWSNYLFDDYGADVDRFQSMDPDLLIGILSPHAYPGDPTHPAGFAPSGNVGRFRHTGDYGYPPTAPYPQDPANDPLGDDNAYDNVANVAQTRVAADSRYLYLRFSLTDLAADSTVIGLAIDTDDQPGTGGGAWPFEARLSSPGWERFLTVWGTGGALTSPDGQSQDLTPAGGAVREDLAANTMDVRVPLAAISSERRSRWRLIAGAGRWDASQRQWAPPSLTTTQSTSPGNLAHYPRVYELPFHHGEPNSLWSDTKQADDLRDGSVASDDWTVDVAQLQRGASVPMPCTAGPKEQTFDAFSPGAPTAEGMTALPTQNGGVANLHNVNYVYRWHVQPLALMLPPSVCSRTARPPSLDLFFHPANVNQNAWSVGVEGDHDRVNYLHDPPLGFDYVTSLAKRYNRITAAGLGRTEGWNYGDAPGEEAADWDAFQAATSRYRHDPERVRVTGMSGRLGAPFFAETWPDKVASVYTVSNHTADSPKVANLRNTPWVFLHGTSYLELDSDLPGYAALDDHLSSLGYQYLHMTWNGRGHDFNLLDQAYGLVEPWTSAPRIHPARVTYYVDPKDRRPGLPLFPGVDWVRGMSLADPGTPAQVDLTDLAKANRLPVRETRFDCTFTNLGTSDDVEYDGLSYETPDTLAARMPDVVAQGWTVSKPCVYTVTPEGRPAVANAVSGTLKNTASVTLDADAMHLDVRRPIDVSRIRSSTPVNIEIVSRRGRRTVTVPASG